jgi:hypothetical protein
MKVLIVVARIRKPDLLLEKGNHDSL